MQWDCGSVSDGLTGVWWCGKGGRQSPLAACMTALPSERLHYRFAVRLEGIGALITKQQGLASAMPGMLEAMSHVETVALRRLAVKNLTVCTGSDYHKARESSNLRWSQAARQQEWGRTGYN